MKFLPFLLSILFVHECKAQTSSVYPYNKDENSLLWEISGKGIRKPSYLFGTFHLMCKEDINPGKNVRNVIKYADEVYFELDLDDLSNTLGALLFMNMKNDTTLKQLYTTADYKKVENYFMDSLKTSMNLIQTIKPFFLQALLIPKLMPCKKLSGVEDVLMKIAKENKKEIKGLETFAFQASIFDSIPYNVQAKELLKSIDSLFEYKKSIETLLSIYKTQQLQQIEKANNDEFGPGNFQEILLDNRNREWVIQLHKLLPEKKLFIAVGAGHLAGKNGLIQLLRREGYIVKPVENKEN